MVYAFDLLECQIGERNMMIIVKEHMRVPDFLLQVHYGQEGPGLARSHHV